MSLALVSQSCTDALAALAVPATDTAPLHVVRADIAALLQLIDLLATKLALALRPPAPSYAAAAPVLRDLAQHVSALAHCARLLHNDLHGASLTKHVTARVRDIIDALRALVQSFLDSPGEAYLVRTATLLDLITSARSPSGIPRDNQAAVHCAWQSDRDALEDNLQEIARMIKDAESGDTPDDGWDEIGFGTTAMDKHELARAENVHQLLRLTTLLHKRIFLDLLAHPSSAPVSAFDALLLQSNLLLSTSDDLVAALYTPHDPANVHIQILELAKISTSLQSQLPVFLPATAEATSSSPTKKRADQKWFDTCVDQILRLCASATESSSATQHLASSE
ncbi:hypothetical protein HD554DRAFT_2025334 [Boletus coccyginus]|nr:hypothetical protein HD554DRAFT_2025334 [Boletus coccyginus]